MRKSSSQCFVGLFLCLVFSQLQAVQLSTDGTGEVLIYPYYTVNNDLNTLYTIVNNSGDTKALTVRFLEGGNGKEVLLFHVYLSAFDVWSGALVPAVSTMPDHQGEESVVHITSDKSCAPYLNKTGQEFLPFFIDLDLDPDNQSMERATEGHLEVIEIGQFTSLGIGWADHGVVGVPANCGGFETEWNDGQWDLLELDTPNGGLFGAASLVNVAEGIAFSYDAVALQNFWDPVPASVEFPAPGLSIPNLNSAWPQSIVVANDGEVYQSSWDQGHQAVSAVLMKTQILNEYGLDSVVSGQSEWVVSFPTKNYHNAEQAADLPPFSFQWDGSQACEFYQIEIWDRETVHRSDFGCGVLCPPGAFTPQFCQATNVLRFESTAGGNSADQRLLSSRNQKTVPGPFGFYTESGWAAIDFGASHALSDDSGVTIQGLPVTGFVVQQYTNASAQPGLLAQYGALFSHKSRLEVSQD